jgi:membrane-associated phospholipid phosphatase
VKILPPSSRAVLLGAILCIGPSAFAGGPLALRHPFTQDSTASARRPLPAIVVDDLTITLHDAVGFFAAPLSFDRTDIDRVIAGTGAVGIVMAMDEPLNNLLVTYPPPEAMKGPLDWGEEWGRIRTMQLASLAVYAGGLALREDEVRVTGRLMGEALLLAGVPAITLQYTLGRSRPYSGKGAFDYNFFEWSDEYQSLPSGHATVAFAVSTVLAKRIDRWWVSVPLYASAGLTVLSMGWRNQHWPSDLVIGAALGYLAGSFVVQREEERSAGQGTAGGSNGPRLRAGIGPGGVTLTYRLY